MCDQSTRVGVQKIQGGLTDKIQSSCLSSLHPKHVAFRCKIARKMKNIRERLDGIAEERSKFHLTEIVKDKRRGVLDRRQTTSVITQPQFYGRDEDKDKIIDFWSVMLLVLGCPGFEPQPLHILCIITMVQTPTPAYIMY